MTLRVVGTRSVLPGIPTQSVGTSKQNLGAPRTCGSQLADECGVSFTVDVPDTLHFVEGYCPYAPQRFFSVSFINAASSLA